MPIALVGSAAGGTSPLNTDTLSFPVTVQAGADFLVAALCLNSFTGTITSVVFNGSEQMQQRIYQTNAPNNRRTAIFYLVNPTVTTANVVVTLSELAQQILGVAAAASGVDPNSGIAGNAGGQPLTPSGTAFTFDLSTTQNNSVVIDAFAGNDESNPTPTGDNTGNELADRIGNQARLAVSFAEIAAVGNANMDWSVAPTSSGSQCAMELREATGGPSRLLLLHARGDN